MFDGALEAVHHLNDAGYLLSAATGKSRAGLRRFLDAQDIAHLFLATQTADDAPSKPHPQMVLNCLNGTGVDASNAVMIGDTEFDMAMGRAAGTRAIGVRWGYHEDARVLRGGAERMVDSFAELPETGARGCWVRRETILDINQHRGNRWRAGRSCWMAVA